MTSTPASSPVPVAEALTGAQAEQLACAHLEAAGLSVIQRNYRCPPGEIDLIMNDGDTLVFVEVRYRQSDRFGSAAESVTPTKRARLEAAALHFLAKHAINRPCRFDVVALSGTPARMAWHRDAFQTD